MEYYYHERLSDYITRIVDLAGIACYLIEGRNTACLLDTCCGYGNIRNYVEKLTNKPVFVVLTHGHYDHTGGAGLFDTVYMNELDLPVLRKHEKCRKEFFEWDRQSIPVLETIPYEEVRIYSGTPKSLAENRIFDLGGIHIQMIPARGHTPGMMCALIPEERTIFFGDACGMNVLLHDEFSSSVFEYLETLKRLKQLENQYDVIYRNHGSFTNEKMLLDNVMKCAELILRGEDDHVPVTMYGVSLFQAKASDTSGKMAGNIIYAQDKICVNELCKLREEGTDSL